MFIAHAVQVGACSNPKCKAIHFMCFDENEQLVCDAVFSKTEALQLIKDVQGLLYILATDKDR